MPRLPSAESLGQRPALQPVRQISGYDGGAVARATGDLGRAMWDAGEEIAKQDDAQAVFEARRKLDDWERTAIYDSKTGVASKLGRDALELPQTVPADFDAFASQVSESLTNPRQQRVFQEMAQSRRNQIADFTVRHALTQKTVFETGQYKADVDASANRTAMLVAGGDMANAAAEVSVMRDRTIGFLRGQGKSEEEIGQALRENTSRVHVSAIGQMLDDDKPLEAQKYLRANGGDMRVEDLLRAQGIVGKQVDAQTALLAATSAVAAARAAVVPTDMGRLTTLVMGAESGGKRFGPDGKLLTSPKGAKGEMQVMDGTNLDPGFGVKPAQDDSPDERARVGRDYLGAMVKEFGGNVTQALAAYNAGPQAVKDAITRAGARPGADWLTFLPNETQAYVTKIGQAYSQGGGAPAMPTLQDVHDKIRTEVGTSRPHLLQAALSEGSRQYEDLLKAKKDGEAQALSAGLQWLEQNGGRWSQMPASLRNAIAPKDADNAMNYGARVAKGDDVTDPIVFQKMATDDAWLRGMSDAEFFNQSRKLSQSDAQQMATRRGGLLNKPGKNGPSDLDYAAVNNVFNNRLATMGMDPTPRDGSGDAQRVGAMRQAAWQYVLGAQLQAGKKFGDAEVAAKLDELFAKNVKFQTSFLGISTGGTSQRLMGVGYGDIPGDVKDRIKADFKRAGIDKPNDGDILGAYLQIKAAGR